MTGKKLIKIKSIFFADRGRTDVQTALSGINSIAGDVKASTARRLPA